MEKTVKLVVLFLLFEFCLCLSIVPANQTSLARAKRLVGRSTCRLCRSCAHDGPYSVDSGSLIHDGDWGPWNTFGESCGDDYSGHWNTWSLCCSRPQPECRLCEGCGGDYSEYMGSRLNVGDWGPYRVFQRGCSGSYTGSWNEISFCCRSEISGCRMCASCGAGMHEVGRRLRQGDYGPWRVVSSDTCTPSHHNGRVITSWDMAICCPIL